MRIAIIAVVCLSGCVHIDRATLMSSTAALACDWGQTRYQAELGWERYREKNPIMGSRPSTMQVDAYFAAAAAVNLAIWAVLPKGWKSAIPASVTGIQARSIVRNSKYTGWCGV